MSRTNSEHSNKVKAGLRKAWADGAISGNPDIENARKIALQTVADDADNFARILLPVLQKLSEAGIVTRSAIARELNARNIPTARGGKWYPMTVKNLMERIDSIS